MKPWIYKYRPKKTDDIIGQKRAVTELGAFIKKGGTAFLYGPTGIGKTASVHALAQEQDFELLEMNASDFRKKDHINSIIGNSIKQQSLFNKPKLILIDEVDGISGRKDYGGLAAITKILSISTFPIILTANDPYDSKFKALRKKCKMIEFDALDYTAVHQTLASIADAEGVKYDESALKSLARMAGGDMRAAINDLQSLTTDRELTKDDLDILSQRDQTETIQQALLKIFKTTDLSVAIPALYNVNDDLEKTMLWVDENLPKEYEGKDLARAYEWVSKADIFLRRIRRWQYWRFLVYVNAFLTGGIATSKEKRNPKIIEYVQTKRLLKIWMSNMKNQKRKSILKKIADATHVSTKRALNDTFPYVKKIFQNNPRESTRIAEFLELEKDEVAWLKR